MRGGGGHMAAEAMGKDPGGGAVRWSTLRLSTHRQTAAVLAEPPALSRGSRRRQGTTSAVPRGFLPPARPPAAQNGRDAGELVSCKNGLCCGVARSVVSAVYVERFVPWESRSGQNVWGTEARGAELKVTSLIRFGYFSFRIACSSSIRLDPISGMGACP